MPRERSRSRERGVRGRSRSRERDRDRHRKHRKRRFSDEDEGFSNWKIGMVVGVVIVCFAVLYPSLFHPLLMGLLGRKEPTTSNTQSRPPIHPGMGSRPGPPHGGGRGDVHPAMRMAAAQAESHSGGGGGGRGMMTWLMPLYTVGVVAFLLYTIFKQKKKARKRRGSYSDGYATESEDEYDERKLGRKNMRSLQERLRQTEEAMSKILEQLETVQAEGKLNLEEKPSDKASTSKSPEEAAQNEKNEQYINDLEQALKDFKVLSAEYEKVKKSRGRTTKDSDDSEDDQLDEVSSLSDAEENDDFERKNQKLDENQSEEDEAEKNSGNSEESEDESGSKSISRENSKEKSDISTIVPNLDLPSESIIQSNITNKSNARRRPKKIE